MLDVSTYATAPVTVPVVHGDCVLLCFSLII